MVTLIYVRLDVQPEVKLDYKLGYNLGKRLGKVWFSKIISEKIGTIVRMRDSYTNPSETKRIESFEIFGLMNRIHKTGI